MSKGFTALPNDIYEAIYGSNLNSLEIRAILYLWRTTYGWQRHKKRLESRDIPYSEWAKNLNTPKSHI